MKESGTNRAILLISGNMGTRESHLDGARWEISRRCGQLTATSAIYETEAWGPPGQPPFLNQALDLVTPLDAHSLLQTLLDIEAGMGRLRETRYGPRTIDIDILFFNNEVIDRPGLTIPHPRLHERRFSRQCLMDLDPELVHPALNKSVRTLMAECTDPLSVNKYN